MAINNLDKTQEWQHTGSSKAVIKQKFEKKEINKKGTKKSQV